MNKIVLIGRLTKNLELRYTQSNKAVINFDIAVNRDYKNTEGDYDTDFINCQIWGAIAETMSKYCKKGDLIAVSGALRVDKYQNEKGENRYKTYAAVDKIDFLSTKKEEEKEKPKASDEQIYADFGDSIEISDEDIAF